MPKRTEKWVPITIYLYRGDERLLRWVLATMGETNVSGVFRSALRLYAGMIASTIGSVAPIDEPPGVDKTDT